MLQWIPWRTAWAPGREDFPEGIEFFLNHFTEFSEPARDEKRSVFGGTNGFGAQGIVDEGWPGILTSLEKSPLASGHGDRHYWYYRQELFKHL